MKKKDTTKSTNSKEVDDTRNIGVLNKEVPKKTHLPSYQYAGKESVTDSIAEAIPPQIIPTKRTGSIFAGMFIIVLIIAIFQFPISSILAGKIDVAIQIGYPIMFLEFQLSGSQESVFKLGMLLIDLLIYLIIAYAIDVVLNLFLKKPIIQSEEDQKKRPAIFKNRKPNIAEKAVEKIAEKKQLK